MSEPFQLVTNCTFKGKDYLVQMCVLNSKRLELIVTDKIMAEDWQCEYDASYIEALTHKTGNFKQFDVFVMMLKSGLLKTSDCITLDLLTLEDLEQLRCKKINSQSSSRTNQSQNLNKRYLIVTYSVEFDRIHYPLPLDYCGPPNPNVLQSNIRRLEAEVQRLKQKNTHLSQNDEGDMKRLKEKIQSLIEDNTVLTNEVQRLNKALSKRGKPTKNNVILQNTLKKLEEQVLYEKSHNQQTVIKLKAENRQLKEQIEELKKSEKYLKLKLKDTTRYSSVRGSRRLLRNYLTPENSLDRKRSIPGERLETPLFCPTLPNWNGSITTKANNLKTKKCQNRFLSSSSSESGKVKPRKGRSRERKPLSARKKDFYLAKSSTCRKSSNERSRHSSEDGKSSHMTQKSKTTIAEKYSKSQEQIPGNVNFAISSQPKICSRESSLSSRGSSKHSRNSRFSNRGSGDYQAGNNKQTSRSTKSQDLKFTMSDLETRIHALQNLLSEGLSF